MIADATRTTPDLSGYREEIQRCNKLLADLTVREKRSAMMFLRGRRSESAWDAECDEYVRDRHMLERTLKAAEETVVQFEVADLTRESMTAAIAAVRERLRSARREDRRTIVHALIPDQTGYGIVVHPNGDIVIDAGLLTSAGEVTETTADKAFRSACPGS